VAVRDGELAPAAFHTWLAQDFQLVVAAAATEAKPGQATVDDYVAKVIAEIAFWDMSESL
jgi:thiaminase